MSNAAFTEKLLGEIEETGGDDGLPVQAAAFAKQSFKDVMAIFDAEGVTLTPIMQLLLIEAHASLIATVGAVLSSQKILEGQKEAVTIQ